MADKDADKVDETASDDADKPEPSRPVIDADAPGSVKLLRMIDGYVGVAELALLCVFLCMMIASGVWETYAFFTKTNEAKPAELIKYAVFFSALTGAALAAQRGQMISMDIVSRLLKPRTRAIARIVTTLFTIVMCYYLVKKGWQVYEVKKNVAEKYIYISQAKGALAVCLAGIALGFHFTVHMVIDVLYLAAGKLPPEDGEVRAH